MSCLKIFRFPSLPGEPTVNAQMNALVAQSDVFEALFQSAFLEKTGVVEVKYFSEKCINWGVNYKLEKKHLLRKTT